MLERTPKFLQIRFDVRKYRAPLHRRVANGAAAFIQRVLIFRRGRVARKERISLRPRDNRAFAPWHETIAFEFLVRCKVHFVLPLRSSLEPGLAATPVRCRL